MTLPLLALLVACAPSPDSVVTGIKSENPMTREDMVEFAKKYDEPEVVQALMGALADPSPTVRRLACKSLAEISDKTAVPALIQVVQTETEDPILREAIDALGRIQDPSAVDALVALVDAAEPDRVPLNAIWALGTIGDKRALASLTRIREGTRDPYVLYNTNEALRNVH